MPWILRIKKKTQTTNYITKSAVTGQQTKPNKFLKRHPTRNPDKSKHIGRTDQAIEKH